MPRSPTRPVRARSASRRSPTRRPDRRSGRCAIAAPSAARSPTTIRTPTIRRPASGSAPPSSPTSGASRPTISSRACSRPRSRRTRSSQGELPDRQEGGLREVPQSGLALRAGRRVRVEARLRDPRRRHRRRLNGVFRVTSFEEALKKRFAREVARGHDDPGRRHEQRHPWQRRISRASRRRAGAPRARQGDGLRLSERRTARGLRISACALAPANTNL